jgi:hypothetical protein
MRWTAAPIAKLVAALARGGLVIGLVGLPFESRWWDVGAALVWGFVFAWYATSDHSGPAALDRSGPPLAGDRDRRDVDQFADGGRRARDNAPGPGVVVDGRDRGYTGATAVTVAGGDGAHPGPA